MAWRHGASVAVALTLLVAACESGPPPPGGAISSMPLEVTIEALATALEQEGLTVQRSEQGLRASSTAPGFARCDPVNVRDGSGDGSRNVFTSVSDTRAQAAIRFTPADAGADAGTRVTWETSYSGRYHNRVNNTWFERPCRGTGSLERLLESAVRR
jgi:hypothetical protein